MDEGWRPSDADGAADRRGGGVAKLVGMDCELGNAVQGVDEEAGSGRLASGALLAQIDGVSACPPGEHGRDNPQDQERRFLTNGGCAYRDLDHCEICTPEALSAFDATACWHAALRLARDALARANARLPSGQRILVLVNCSDGRGNSYGSHLNILISRRLWDELFLHRLYPCLFVLASHQASSIVYTGQGKCGAENGRPPVPFQISQRADFISRLCGPQTTRDRPLVNSRDEPLCGEADPGGAAGRPAGRLARLHCIFFDATLCHGSTLLKIGTMQVVLAMLEAGALGTESMLEDPLHALQAFSRDPLLKARARLVDGRQVSAVELQLRICERAQAFVAAGRCAGLVPDAAAIVALWADTLAKLAGRDFDALAPRLDWVLKRALIEPALAGRGLDWSAPQAKHLDHVYASLDADEGLFWAAQRAGLTEPQVDDSRIEHFRYSPPEDTRAWTRAMLLRHLPRQLVHRVDWDRIELALPHLAPTRPVICLPDPLGHTRRYWSALGEPTAQGVAGSQSFDRGGNT